MNIHKSPTNHGDAVFLRLAACIIVYQTIALLIYNKINITNEYIMQWTFVAFHTKQYIVPKKWVITRKANRISGNKANQINFM